MKRIASELKLISAKEFGTGVDYYLRVIAKGQSIKVPIDFKFSFGEHFGDGFIKVRVTLKSKGKQKVINESKWVIASDAKGKAVIFRTAALQQYISKFTGRIKKAHQIEKLHYVEWPINVSDLLYHTQTGLIKTKLNSASIKIALEKIKKIEAAKINPKPKIHIPKAKISKKQKTKPNNEPKHTTTQMFRKGTRGK